MVSMEQQRARFRRTRNVFALAASVVLAVAIGWWIKPGGPQTVPEIVASVTLIRGAAASDGLALIRGGQLEAGAWVETSAQAGNAGRVAVRLPDGQSVRIDSDSRVRFDARSEMTLERGAVYVDTAGSSSGAGVRISTPYGMVRDIGTQFEVRVGETGASNLTVRVREGEVSLERQGETHSAHAGEELNLQGEDLGRTTVEPSAGAWDWVLSVTPAMDIEGASLTSYLEWVSRETGRELHFADQTLAESSATILVHGSIEGMTPEESLSVVLPGSGLGYQVENGSLLIAKP